MVGQKNVISTKTAQTALPKFVRQLDEPSMSPREGLEAATLHEPIEVCSDKAVFYCPEESSFYSYCLERLIFSQRSSFQSVVEFGCGDGSPVIHALTRTPFSGIIHGYDLNASACRLAQSRIRNYCLGHRYRVYNQSFFDAARPDAEYLIANPPYLPAPDEEIQIPALRGGNDGSGITRQLLTLDYPAALLMISSYSNPVETIDHAIAHDYYVADFMVSPLSFGCYSSEPKVKATIHQLQQERQAFCTDHIYFLAGVLFRKQHPAAIDLSAELINVMTAL